MQLPLVPQGGYREVMATFFVGLGYSLRRIECWKNKKLIPIMGIVVLAFLSIISPTELIPKATFVQWATIVVTGIIGFIVVYYISISLSQRKWIVSRILNYIGQRTFYILTFHFLTFKVASLIKIGLYGYDIRMIGCHPVIPPNEGDYCFWLVYSAIAIILSLVLERIIYQISIKIIKVDHLI